MGCKVVVGIRRALGRARTGDGFCRALGRARTGDGFCRALGRARTGGEIAVFRDWW